MELYGFGKEVRSSDCITDGLIARINLLDRLELIDQMRNEPQSVLYIDPSLKTSNDCLSALPSMGPVTGTPYDNHQENYQDWPEGY